MSIFNLFDSIKPSILIVDDDKAILHCLGRIFQRSGYDVTTVERGKEALEKINTTYFDVALIDWRLEDMEGIDLLPTIISRSPKTVKVMLTGRAMPPTFLGADAFLGKPVEPQKLLSIIDTKLRGIEVKQTRA